jgi:formylglycine-generating enzyme required for sulfatase activity
MSLVRWLGFSCVSAIVGAALAADPPGPPATPDEVLKRFVAEFVQLTPGTDKFPASFAMGSVGDAPDAEKPAVTVTLRQPFAVARYEVTQELYQTIVGRNPSKWKGRRNSVEMVSWEEANEFCRKATAELRRRKLIREEEEVRLPSEAEWEYACRAGSKTAYSFGDKAADLRDYAWFTGNAKGNDPPVGKKKPNAWGLFDMHGYVWEWCADAWSPTHKDAATDGRPRVNKEVRERVLRGGSWADDADHCRSAFRHHKPLDFRSDAVGFRCVRAAVPKTTPKEKSR